MPPRLPPRLDGCAFEPTDRTWVPKQQIKHVPPEQKKLLLKGFSFQAEKARTGQAACKRCGEKIAKDSLRVGYPSKDHRGDYCALVQWLHVPCARGDEALVKLVKKGDAAVQKGVFGFDALTDEEKVLLCEGLLRVPDAEEEAEEDDQPPAAPEARKLEPHPKPAGLKVDLLPYQAEGLGWMLAREADPSTRGGVLADEMGMGKTLETIAYILASPNRGPTLVVTPAAAMLQWHNEIKRFCEPGTLDVELYYGFDRGRISFEGRANLVVLTTYQTLEADYRKEVNKTKVACEWCGRMFLPEKLQYHLKYYCGPEAERTEKQQKQEKKTEAVKMMKIGGHETEIRLNPLTAIRTVGVKAARRLRSKQPEDAEGASETAPPFMPLPVSVLPAEAKEALAGSGAPEPPAAAAAAAAAGSGGGVPKSQGRGSGKGRGRGRGKKTAAAAASPDTTADLQPMEVTPPLSSTTTAASSGGVWQKELGDGQRGLKRSHEDLARTPDGASASAVLARQLEAPSPADQAAPAPVRLKRWGRAAIKSEVAAAVKAEPAAESAEQQAMTTAAAATPSASSSSTSSWGAALRLRAQHAAASAAPRVIGLDGLGDSDSDLEVCRPCGEDDAPRGQSLWKTPSSSSSSGVPAPPGDTAAATTSASAAAAGASSASCRRKGELPEERPDENEDDYEGAIDLSHSPIFRVEWARVVLDEAHRIKGRTNSTAQAAFALRASAARWCLSGTPLQNRVGEVYSLIRFVRFYPYAHYFCSKKGCGCVSLHYRFDERGYCKGCDHTKMQHRSYFAQNVSNPIKKFGFIGAGKKAMEALRTDVLNRILLRRTKAERAADIKLPPLEVTIRRDTLSAEEKDFYQSMYMQSRTSFDTYVDRGTLLHNYAHVFDLIMRLRQAVDHPYLIVHGTLSRANGLIPTQSRGDADVCALCQDDVDDAANRVAAQCGHAFHRDCVQEYLEQAPELPGGGIGCPTCFRPMTLNLDAPADEEDDDAGRETSRGQADGFGSSSSGGPKAHKSIMSQIKSSEFKSSTKIEALYQEVRKMLIADKTSKAIVFSQFTRFLELIDFRLKREGITTAMCTGTMPVVSRNNIVISFQTDPSLKVLLLSLKAGGEGLNLQAADHIFVMDPWWNPAAELQAIQRAHRIGQTRKVNAVRFVTTGTIEEKIVELQQKKQSVFDCTVGCDNQALQRLTAEDIQFLFNQ
eukprot:TRINITY_DN7739_c0_g2_i1.p1 TRINITY_DN7739_c0_g2~~TRINITY_DN7739_c0_g2_i1.p1  ORF type:complete len:1202 (+),score=339.40 TRINITY_DN7739_c0_g2_i1:57-3662(+)